MATSTPALVLRASRTYLMALSDFFYARPGPPRVHKATLVVGIILARSVPKTSQKKWKLYTTTKVHGGTLCVEGGRIIHEKCACLKAWTFSSWKGSGPSTWIL